MSDPVIRNIFFNRKICFRNLPVDPRANKFIPHCTLHIRLMALKRDFAPVSKISKSGRDDPMVENTFLFIHQVPEGRPYTHDLIKQRSPLLNARVNLDHHPACLYTHVAVSPLSVLLKL
jgi:hypothetical protein